QAALRERDDIDATPNLLVMQQKRATTIDFSKPMHRDRVLPSKSRADVEEVIVRHGIRHLFFDPFYNLCGAADMSDRNMQVPDLTRWLDHLQGAFGVEVWFSHIGDGSKMSDGLFGSKAWRMYAECIVGIERKDVTGNLYSDFTFYIEPKRYRI